MLEMLPEEESRLASVADIQLAKCGAMFYDTEIVRMVPMQNEVRDPTFQYCNGWQDYSGMGISVIGAYDFVTRAYKVFLHDNFAELSRLIDGRNIIIGFNSNRFDDNLLRANGIQLPKEKTFDLWKEIVNTQPPGQRAGFSLNNMLKANDLQSKSGDGGNAPKLAQRGHWGELINYCLDDNRLSVQLLRLACNDLMKSPKTGSYLKIKKPWEIVDVSNAPEALW